MVLGVAHPRVPRYIFLSLFAVSIYEKKRTLTCLAFFLAQVSVRLVVAPGGAGGARGSHIQCKVTRAHRPHLTPTP